MAPAPKYLPIVALFLASTEAGAGEKSDVFVNLNFYPYLSSVETDADFTINTSTSLPFRFSYFGFINVGEFFSFDKKEVLTSEQNIRWRIIEEAPFDLAAQAMLRGSTSHKSWQVGLRWRLNDTRIIRDFLEALNVTYSVSFYPKRFNTGTNSEHDEVRQISHSIQAKFPALSQRLYLSSFVDQNFVRQGDSGQTKYPVVSESQLGFRIYKQIYAVAEYRINELRSTRSTNRAIGLEIKSRW